MHQRILLPVLLLAAFAVPADAATFFVSNSNDAGLGSLRNAIQLANDNPGADEIEFALPAGAPAIMPLTPLPTITNAVTIGVTRIADIEISGALAPPGSRGLHVTAHDAWIEGVAIYAFAADVSQNGGEGIVLEGGTGNVVNACFIGNRQGSSAGGNGGPGIRIADSSFNFISSNLIAGNAVGVQIEGNSDSNELYGNVIGTLTGSGLIGNLGHGVAVLSGSDTLLGTDGPCPICVNNSIAGNGGSGIFIGPGADGTRVMLADVGPGNVGHGVEIQGGQSSQIGAAISGNTGAGVFVGSGSGNTIRAGISGNGGLGIDLAPAGITANDAGDLDGGPNGLQNFPILTSVVTSPGAVVTLTGLLQSASSSPYVLDFYSSESCDGSGNGEGQHYFGSTNVATDVAGNAPFNVAFPGIVLQGGGWITATATDALGSTSEFSPCFLVALPMVSQIQPDSGPDTGGTPVDILGQNFDPAATVRIGGVAPSNVVITSPTEIDADTPALTPGTLNDVTVTNSDGQMDTLIEGWFSNFLDVQEAHLFHDFVEVIFRAKVTAGCGFGNYCPDQAVPRDQMAVFLLRSKNGPNYLPPPETGTVFNDVPAGAFAADFIEALAAAQVTFGCGGGNYCPTDPVTRAQMSVFLLRMLEGPTYNPPPATGTEFTDVPANGFAAAWIEEIFARGITAGCGGGLFCPTDSTTRGQMAVFLTVTFGL